MKRVKLAAQQRVMLLAVENFFRAFVAENREKIEELLSGDIDLSTGSGQL